MLLLCGLVRAFLPSRPASQRLARLPPRFCRRFGLPESLPCSACSGWSAINLGEAPGENSRLLFKLRSPAKLHDQIPSTRRPSQPGSIDINCPPRYSVFSFRRLPVSPAVAKPRQSFPMSATSGVNVCPKPTFHGSISRAMTTSPPHAFGCHGDRDGSPGYRVISRDALLTILHVLTGTPVLRPCVWCLLRLHPSEIDQRHPESSCREARI